MNLQQLIEELEKEPKERIIKYGFTNPHSHRGNYYDLAFEPAENVTIESMIASAKSAIGKTFNGYKGGDFRMDLYTSVHFAEYGESGEEITYYGLAFMLGRQDPKTASGKLESDEVK